MSKYKALKSGDIGVKWKGTVLVDNTRRYPKVKRK